ncbi:phage tail protein [Streptococcus cristatus]|uniref:phage tail protein n=1 Tax=Streptococcus cristatus TaxID=45634 RepID=UPI0039C4D80B
MITFIDEKGTEHSALVAYSMTNAVNGELSVKGTIYTNDKVLHSIDRGWRFRLDDEYYRVTYAKPNDTGRQIEVEFDAVHQFFYDMSKSMVYDTLNGSKPFETYLQAIFSGSGYTYNLETTVGSIRKENFGNKSRLSLFNDIIKAAGLEFSVRGHVVRILKRIGTDLSAIVRKDFNMNELKIEKNINSFVTYQRGLGAWKDDEDHSKGRYESEYESPLAKIYGRIEAEPVVDERYKETGKLLERLKENVDKSYKVSVEIDMEDLSRAGYRLSRPNPGDFIMAINETLGFRQKVRIVSFTSEYDVGSNLISRKVVCNDIGSVQRRASEMSSLARSVQDVASENAKAIATATKALVSADGKNTIYFSESKPRDEPVGTLRKGDQLYLKEGEKTNLYFWNGAEWELNPLEMDLVKFRKEYESKTKEIDKSITTQTQQTAQALRTAGANASAIEAAKGTITKLNQDLTGAKQNNQAAIDRLKSDFASAQRTANDQTALLRSDLANIRTKQTQAESEIAKQVQALNTAKTELAGVKSAQATFEQTTTRRLAELANVADGKANRSELVQTAEELKSRIASVQVGGTNLLAYVNFNAEGYYQNSFKRDLKYVYSNLIEVRSTDYLLQIWELEPQGKRLWAGLQLFDEQRNPIANGYSTFWFNGHLKQVIKPPNNAKYLAISFENLILDKTKAKFKLETGTLATDWSPAPEDQEERLTAAESTFKQKADSLEASVSSLREGLSTKADSSALTLLSDRISASVKSLETDTQNKLDSKLSTTEFDVRASGIRQEIVNATKGKADKALVTAEAGRLREEFSKILLGNENLFVLKRSSSGYLSGGKNLGPAGIPNEKTSDFIAVTPDEKVTFQIWVTVPKGGQAWRAWQFYTKEKELLSTRQVSGYEVVEGKQYARHLITVPANSAFIRVSARMYADGLVKVERSDVFSDWVPSIEDADGLITDAKATFERTAQGLRTDLSAIQSYVNADGMRAEALRTYSREETARQLTAERKAIESGYVAKTTYAEDVKGISRRFEELAVGGRNLALGTSKEWSAPFTSFSGNANVCPLLYKVLTDGLQVGDILRSKIILKYTDVRPAAGKTATVWLQGNGNVTGWTAGAYNGSPAKTLSGSGEITFEHSFKITENHLKNAYWNWMFRTDFIASGSLQWRLAKVESGSVYTSWSPAPEDATAYADTKLAEFKQGIDGQLASVQSVLNTANGSLTSFNNWKQSAQETLNKVGKVESGLNETKTSLAEFKRTAEGQLTTITQQVAGKASQTDFQRVQETSKLYERLIGSTEKEVTDKVSRMVMTNQLFQTEVSKNQGLRTVQSQLAGSWSIKNLNSASDILGQLNLNPDGSVAINEGLISIGDKTHIKNGIIKNAMIESILADKVAAGTLNAANVNIINLNANKIVGLDANFIKSKIELAFIEWMKGKTISAQNDAMQINLNDGHVLFYNDDASIKRVAAGYPTQFIRYENKQENGQNHGRTIIGSNRNGTNVWKSVSFAGLVIDNNSNNSVDKIYQFGDYNHMRHAQGDDGWNFSVVTQAMTPGVWNKNSEIWARHFVVPRNTKGDTDSPTQFIRLEESVAAIWNILNHAASGQVTMTQAMKNLINSRKAAWDIVRNVG